MDLKKLLKQFKLNESTISMILGILVIVVAGVLLINFFRDQDTGTTLPTGEVTEAESNGTTIVRDGETYHVVQENDTLWSIAEKYYKSGYNWVDIAEENNLENSDSITSGQELLIPDTEAKLATVIETTETVTPTIEPVTTEEITPTATLTATQSPTPTLSEISPSPTETVSTDSDATITEGTYTVAKGDSLWVIAERAYGDGYRWVDIAEANSLVNPDIIHPGNVLTLPR